jgi:hypothetical protein
MLTVAESVISLPSWEGLREGDRKVCDISPHKMNGVLECVFIKG